MMDKDVWHPALVLVTEGPDEAEKRATARILELAEAGDRTGVSIWSNILDTIEELKRTGIRPDETLH